MIHFVHGIAKGEIISMALSHSDFGRAWADEGERRRAWFRPKERAFLPRKRGPNDNVYHGIPSIVPSRFLCFSFYVPFSRPVSVFPSLRRGPTTVRPPPAAVCARAWTMLHAVLCLSLAAAAVAADPPSAEGKSRGLSLLLYLINSLYPSVRNMVSFAKTLNSFIYNIRFCLSSNILAELTKRIPTTRRVLHVQKRVDRFWIFHFERAPRLLNSFFLWLDAIFSRFEAFVNRSVM